MNYAVLEFPLMGQAKSSKMSNPSEKSGYAPQAQYGASAPSVQHGAPPVYSVSGGPPLGAAGGFQDLPPPYSTTPNNSLVGSAGKGKNIKNLKLNKIILYSRKPSTAAVPAAIHGPTPARYV